jgi:hypothetical protein
VFGRDLRIVVRRRLFDFNDEALEVEYPRPSDNADEEETLVSLALEFWRKGPARGVILPLPELLAAFVVGMSSIGDEESFNPRSSDSVEPSPPNPGILFLNLS